MLEAASRLIVRNKKTAARKPLQIYRGNAQKVAFTPIKSVKLPIDEFDDINEITVDWLKFRPIIAQTGTYMYKTAQVISKYLKPLYENNDFTIKNIQDFAQMIREQPPLEKNEKYVSYDVESLFTNVPIHDTIKYILEEIYTHNKLPHICSKLIFKRLLLKLAFV